MRPFRNLIVWQKSHALAFSVYQSSRSFPREEIYALTSQIRRVATSVPANIAEGCGHDSDTEFLRYLRISAGSASELEYHILLVHDLGYLPPSDYQPLLSQVIEVKRMLYSMITRISEVRT